MGLEGISPFSSLFCAFLRFLGGNLPFFFAFLRFVLEQGANNCNLLEKWGIPLRPPSRTSGILRFFLWLEIGQFSPHFGAISLLNYTANLEKRGKVHWRKFKSSGDGAPKLQISVPCRGRTCPEPILSEIPFLPSGRPRPDPSPNPPPASSLSATKKSSFGVPEKRGFEDKNCLGRGGVGREKKGIKDAQNKVGFC